MYLFKRELCALTMLLSLTARANEVQIVGARAERTADTWTISVTLKHADVDMAHYADSWRVLTADGQILGTRKLAHPHKDQPFTRDLKKVQIPDTATTVYIEAHDNVHGWAKEKVELKLIEGLRVGGQSPLFSALDQDGKSWSLKDHLGGRYLVVYFYPAAMTGGCTKQACSYRDHITKTSEQTFDIIGISGDAPENLKYFQTAEKLNFTLLSDPDGKIAKAFGVPVKEGEKKITRTVDSKEVELLRNATTARWTFIIDPDGKVIYKDDKVKAMQDLENVKKFLKSTRK